MEISALSENTSVSKEIACEHGLSLFIETNNTRVLFDTGASDKFFDNAQKMEIDLSLVDFALLSHGHYDHGGGLLKFLDINEKSDVYIGLNAFGDFFGRSQTGENKYIGLDKNLLNNERLIHKGTQFKVNDNITVFSKVKGKHPEPKGNDDIFVNIDGKEITDDFVHEQSMIIRENDQYFLITGCAHCGILNIMDKCKTIIGKYPDFVIGGFHLFHFVDGDQAEAENLNRLAEQLLETNAKFYTCHCTGLDAYNQLRKTMGEKIKYLAGGSRITIEQGAKNNE